MYTLEPIGRLWLVTVRDLEMRTCMTVDERMKIEVIKLG